MTNELGDRQAAGVRQGAAFEAAVQTLLRVEGWTIQDTKWLHPELGVEVDIVAKHPETGQVWWIECKGSWEGVRPGNRRTDTVKKAIFNGAMLRLDPDHCPYMVIASHAPKEGTVGATWIERARGVYVDEFRDLTGNA